MTVPAVFNIPGIFDGPVDTQPPIFNVPGVFNPLPAPSTTEDAGGFLDTIFDIGGSILGGLESAGEFLLDQLPDIVRTVAPPLLENQFPLPRRTITGTPIPGTGVAMQGGAMASPAEQLAALAISPPNGAAVATSIPTYPVTNLQTMGACPTRALQIAGPATAAAAYAMSCYGGMRLASSFYAVNPRTGKIHAFLNAGELKPARRLTKARSSRRRRGGR